MMQQQPQPEAKREQADQVIATAIAAAEKRSVAEIAVAILPRADRYRLTAILASVTFYAVFYMVLGWVRADVIVAGEPAAWINSSTWIGAAAWFVPAMALALALLFFLVCEHSKLGVWLTPVHLRRRACQVRARLLFLDQGIDATQDRLGLLICVCKAERQIEILPDRGIAAVIPTERWTALLQLFRSHKQNDVLEAALARLITAVADELALHFPPWPGQRNELPDRPMRFR